MRQRSNSIYFLALFIIISIPCVISIENSPNQNILVNQATVNFISTPGNYTIEFGANAPLSWTITDDDAGPNKQDNEFFLYQNGSQINSIDPPVNNDGIYSYTIMGLALGFHNITLEVITGFTQNATILTTINSAFIEVIPQEAPQLISNPSSTVSIEEGYTVGYLSWTYTDFSPSTYSIFRNGSVQVTSQPWISNTPIVHEDLDPMVVGQIYNYTIEVSDELFQTNSHSVYATVIENPLPVFTSTPNITQISHGNISNSFFVWKINDVDPKEYVLYKDSLPIQQLPFQGNKTIEYSPGQLDFGTYNFTLVVFDYLGQSIVDTYIVSIFDSESPIITLFPNSAVYPVGGTITILSWIATDDNPDQFVIQRNGTQVASGSWSSGLEVGFTPTINLQVGVFNFTITFYDTNGNRASNTVFITILGVNTDTPTLDIASTVYTHSIDELTGSWTSESSTIVDATVTARIYQSSILAKNPIQGTIDNTGSLQLDLVYNGLIPGEYQWIIDFTKVGYQTQTITKNVTVLASMIGYSVEKEDRLVKGDNYIIQLTLFYLEVSNSQRNLKLNTLVNPTNNLVGENVILTISYIDNSGQTKSHQLPPAETNSNGIVILVVNSAITSDFKELISFSITMEFEGFIIENSVITTNLPSIIDNTEGSSNIQGIIIVMLLLILGGIGVWLIWVYLHQRTINKIHEDERLNQLLSIQMIIFANNNGIPLYEGVFVKTETDSTMVAGLSSAISSFVDEFMDTKELGLEVIERKNFSLLTHRSTESVLMIASSPKLPTNYHSQVSEIHYQIENVLQTGTIKAYKDREHSYEELILHTFRNNGIYLNLLSPFSILTDQLEHMIDDPEIKVPKIVKDHKEFLMALEGEEFSIQQFLNKLTIYSEMSTRKCAKILFKLEELQVLT